MSKLKALPNTVNEYIRLIKTLPDNLLNPNKWGNREILIHNVFWHESVVNSVQMLLSGKDAKIPIGSFEEINKRAIEKDKGASIDSLLIRLQEAEKQLEDLAQNPKTRTFKFSFATCEKAHYFMGIVIGLNKHLKSHFPK